MLSVENPPRDPSSQISQLKTSDEKASDKLQLVDLLNSDLDDNNTHPTPKFTIRDYVFDSRSKDIKKNWPFSQENLQLCLKHGVTDVLPPFQSPDTVRNSLLNSCSSDSGLNEKENISKVNGEPSGQSGHVFVDSKNAGCNSIIAVDCLNRNPSGSEGDKEFPSTITSQSCSDIDSVPTDKSSILESETDILPELSVAKPEAVLSASNKTEKTTQAAVKKCRLIVKLSNISNSNTKEDTAVNNFMVSEAMASKVCPVCKTFSSSSNTTLNAHIDQCLSGESTTKWTTNSTVIKHRIKPRKMKSMVEIYATASHCTLEELDRRNGTSWATNSNLPAQEIEASANQKKEGSSPTNCEETPDDGTVYIDANGTKLRILSKSDDSSLFSKVVDSPRPKKLINRDKESKFLSAKKKKLKQVHKHHKLLKHRKKICSPRLHRSSEINDNQDRHFSGNETLEKDGCMTQKFKAQGQVDSSRPDMIRGWACSKRTGLAKKINGRDDHQHSGNYANGDLGVKNDQFSLGNSHVKKSCGRTPNIFENALSSPGSSKGAENSLHSPHDEFREQPSLQKRVALTSVEYKASHDRRSQPDHNVKRWRSDETSNREDDVSLLSRWKFKLNSGLDKNAYDCVVDPKSSGGHHTLLSRGTRFPPLRKKLSSGRTSEPGSRFNLKRKCSSIKNSRVHCISESNNETVSGVGGEHLNQNPGEDGSKMQRTYDIGSLHRTGPLKIRKSGGGVVFSRKEEAMAFKNASQPVSKSFYHDAGDHDGSFILGSVSASQSDVEESGDKSTHTHEKDFDVEPQSELAIGGAIMDFRNSLNTGFHGLAGSSDTHCDSEQFNEAGPLPFEAEAPRSSAEPILSGGQEMFCAAEVPENMIRDNVHVLADLDCSDAQGNYFIEVDPIPIPGPPGSYLPSPGHMDSEDLQGNSSLTSSRVQSSDDHLELVDHSSDSPVSAISTISNSTLARSDLKSSGKLSIRCPTFPDEMRSGFTAAANGDPMVENSSPVFKASDAGVEIISLDELKVNSIITEKGAFRFRSDQPCCCSRKEGFSQNISLNYQESQLLRRRNMAAAVVPGSGKAMTGDVDRRLDTLRSEMSSVTIQSPGSDTATKSPSRPFPCRISADPEVKFPSRDYCESNSPPASNPVLRLMGKNLLVVNKDENVSPQLKVSPNSMTGFVNPQVVKVSGVSIDNPGNQHISHPVVSQNPFFLTESSKPAMQHPDLRWSDRSRENPGIPQMPPLASSAMLSSRGTVRGFMGSLMHHEYIAGYNLPTEERQPLRRLGPSITCDMDNKVVNNPGLRCRNANNTANMVKEIIVIDDTPENEVDSTTVGRHEEGFIHGMGSSSSAGKSMAMTSACDSRSESTLHSYRQYESARYSGSPVDACF
ncbi:hypothetical protein ACH5RR_027700 [Cinchona calisaya]|uniref:Uncharacterized protein n=1 Tax=Cinchona calisaya TaxID=153742 RepID=A0ABD2YQL1_9GENT